MHHAFAPSAHHFTWAQRILGAVDRRCRRGGRSHGRQIGPSAGTTDPRTGLTTARHRRSRDPTIHVPRSRWRSRAVPTRQPGNGDAARQSTCRSWSAATRLGHPAPLGCAVADNRCRAARRSSSGPHDLPPTPGTSRRVRTRLAPVIRHQIPKECGFSPSRTRSRPHQGHRNASLTCGFNACGQGRDRTGDLPLFRRTERPLTCPLSTLMRQIRRTEHVGRMPSVRRSDINRTR